MTNVLVCVKRVPDVSGEVALTADGQALDTGQLGFTISDHEACAVELAVRIATDTGGTATVATIGTAEAVEQLRNALAIGCTAAVHVVADPSTLGPQDVARELVAVAADHDLVLLGNDAADSGNFQVGIRLAYALGRPVVNGVSTVEVEDGAAVARGEGPDGHETFRVPLPAVVTILEGGVEPRYPSVPGRMKAKKVAIDERELSGEAVGAGRVSFTLPPPVSSDVQILGEGAAAAPAVVDLFERIGVLAEMIIVYVETDASGATEMSREAITFARDLSASGGGVPIDALVVGDLPDGLAAQLSSYGVRTVHHAVGDAFAAYSGAAWAAALQAARETAGSVVVTASGTPRGMEVLAHLAARLDVPMAANVISFGGLSPFVVTRQVVGGSVREEMQLAQRPAVFTVAGHAVEARPAEQPGAGEVVEFKPEIAESDLVAKVVSREAPPPDLSGALKSARVVVGAGRGAGGPSGFDDVLEMAEQLDGTLGVSRVVTGAGWRPHHEQIGQTGSRISPELYVACGISGAIQHWAGCASAKTILAINTDAEAPMVTKAHYAVIGDMHEIVPAINEELRRRRG